ncbi:hypothetical protein ACQQ97_07105 [Anaerovoracaceae bacterium SGI.195]
MKWILMIGIMIGLVIWGFKWKIATLALIEYLKEINHFPKKENLNKCSRKILEKCLKTRVD